MEFLTGSKPDSPNSAFRPLPHTISPGSQYLAISCRIGKNLAGAGLTPESPDDMGVTSPWTAESSPVWVSETETDNGDGTVTRTDRRNAPISPGTRDFLRVGYHYTE